MMTRATSLEPRRPPRAQASFSYLTLPFDWPSTCFLQASARKIGFHYVYVADTTCVVLQRLMTAVRASRSLQLEQSIRRAIAFIRSSQGEGIGCWPTDQSPSYI
eukprot:1921541-Pleurochrysis_carterae.AAC.3